MTPYRLLCPHDWQDYELLDCGDFEKLERFGDYVLARPEPQALWARRLPAAEWADRAHARYVREKGRAVTPGADKGQWQTRPNMPENWFVGYQYEGMQLRFRLALTAFGHVGLFPEQAENWKFIYDTTQQLRAAQAEVRVLNLFAYTGGASLAATAAGAKVTHLDAVRQTLTWTNANREASQLGEIRWMAEDALRFVRREVRRGSRYEGIVLDPPAYGRGPKGEKWILEENLPELMELCAELLTPAGAFLVVNLYSMGLSALVIQNLVSQHFGEADYEWGECYLEARTGPCLPLGTFLRFVR